MATTFSPDSLAADLERIRLQHRSRRMEAVISALRERARYHSARHGDVPTPLNQAIGGFSVELASMRQRLAALEAR